MMLVAVCLPPLQGRAGTYEALARSWMASTVHGRRSGLSQSLQGEWNNLTDSDRCALSRRWDCGNACIERTRQCSS